MYKIRLLATVLLVALCTGFYSCSGDDEEEPLRAMIAGDKLFEEYGIIDYNNIEMRYGYIDSQQANFIGLKSNRLWLASFDVDTKQKLVEWNDNKDFDRKRRIDLGYGEYKDVTLTLIAPILLNSTSNSNFVAVLYYRFDNNGDPFSVLVETHAIFKHNSATKDINLGITAKAYKGYKDSYFINNCCYTQTGDTIYVVQKNNNQIDYLNSTMISYEEGIISSTSSIERYNYKIDSYKWRRDIKPSFEVPSNAKSTISILDSSTNIWKYRVDYTFYDGTKKDYTFSINIDNGELNSDTISLVGKWKIDSSDTNGKVEKWDGYPYYIITDTHFYFTDNKGALKSDYCSYTFDKANKILKGKYVDGGNSYEMIVTKQTATQADFKWDEEGDGRKMVTIHCTKVP